jgi:hypothetical protein
MFHRVRASLSDLKKLGNDFASAVRDGHVDAAYALMSTTYKKGVPLARFKSVSKNAYIKDAKTFVLYRTTGAGRQATATGLFTGGSGEVDVSMSCTKEESGWRLNGFSVAGAPAVPAP